MLKSIEIQILKKIRKAKRGSLFFVENFVKIGVHALNRLGLSTQVPMNIIYLTDGSARKIKIGKRTITFKKATPKKRSCSW